MFGLLNINKPPSVTSRDVVNRVQRIVRPLKVGHAGTLDPLATGVLVIAIGQATRLVEYIQRMPKTYLATFLLGRTSDTEDVQGQIQEMPDARVPALDEIQVAAAQLTGEIQQTPPAYSAVKIAGRRAYAMARRGETVDLESRAVTIHRLDLLAYNYPELQLRIVCSSGTYVRSLGRDLARLVGTEAVMSALVRKAIGPFELAAAIDSDNLALHDIQTHLLSPTLALAELPRVVLNADETRRIALGQPIDDHWQITARECTALDDRGNLIAILERLHGGSLKAAKCFVSPCD